jgi:hypothetical protein
VLDEFSSRQSSFRQGKPIRLADGQTWILPAPPKGLERMAAKPFGNDYEGIIQAILEAEDRPEQCRAELALVIILLGYNYRLSPADYEHLLRSTAEDPESRDWQLAFRHLAQDHLDAFMDASGVTSKNNPLSGTQGRISRLLAWLRNRLPSRWFSFGSQG